MDFRFSILWFRLHRVIGALWFLPAAFSVLAILTVAAAIFSARILPDELPFTIDREGIQSVLTILGSSMLTVAVFSLSTLVGAVSRASGNTTPRAVTLIVEDRTAQTSISIFIGAFLFSVVAIVGLSAGVYTDAGRLLLFGVSILVIIAVVVALLRWIARISAIGRTTETVHLVEKAAHQTLKAFAEQPNLGCHRRTGEPGAGMSIAAQDTGFVQHIDTERLNRLAKEHDCSVDVVAMPGDWIAAGAPLVVVSKRLEEEAAESFAGTYTLGRDRTFDLDPRYGMVVLGEVASKALSPGINDAGTAIEAISAQTRVLLAGRDALSSDDGDPPNDRVTVPELDAGGLVADAFRAVGRDAAGMVEVVLFIANCLNELAREPAYSEAARAMLAELAARAEATLDFEPDREAVRAAVSPTVDLPISGHDSGANSQLRG